MSNVIKRISFEDGYVTIENQRTTGDSSFEIERWYDKNGMLHRGNSLPAVIYEDGYEVHWVHGRSRDYKIN